jgi:hypothetical protein
MRKEGDVHVNCTISFKGSVRMTLWNDMTIAEAVHDIIHSGDYEYEVVNGEIVIDDTEDIED